MSSIANVNLIKVFIYYIKIKENVKMLEECLLWRNYKHFFRIPIKEEGKFKIRLEQLTTRDMEYLGKRNGDQSIEYINHETRSN